jgi:hypothetical protein
LTKEAVKLKDSKGIRKNVLAIFFTFILIFLCCGKKESHLRSPERFLETKTFPQYFLNIPLYGVNGMNGLVRFEEGEKVSVTGIYVKGRTGSFLRTLKNDNLIYYPLVESLPFQSESNMLKVRGRVSTDKRPVLSEIIVEEKKNIEEIKSRIEEMYPRLLVCIEEKAHNPKSKLDLGSIDDWHCAGDSNKYFIYGRIYDLMYEFDIGILFSLDNDIIHLEKIYAREFFKGE